MRILVVKTTSLGDIIHTLPALTDAKRHFKTFSVDWVVEEPFSEVPLWHSSVQRIIPIALRRWRKTPWNIQKCKEISVFMKAVRQEKYDYVIDAQGLLKSAAVTILCCAKKRIGLSWHSAREALASLFYNKRAVVPWGQHAVTRARALFAKGLGYPLPETEPDYGIDTTRLPALSFALPKPYYVFLHGTTWATKHWPESYWCELAKTVDAAGQHVLLLWGNEAELARANRIADQLSKALVVPNKLTLSEAMRVLAESRGIVTVDTGLGHLAAALGVPTVSLFGPSDPKNSGTLGQNQTNLSAAFPCAPCHQRACSIIGEKSIDPPCFASLPAQLIWEQLQRQVAEAK